MMLSVIVPFYDEVLYLRNALNSIRAQRIGDLQIIVVNDNPDRFSAHDLAALGVNGAIELVQHPRNLGLSAARNSGMARAHGRFIGFLDSDDYYILGGLADQLAQATATGADITHSQTCFTDLGSTRPRILPRDAAFFSRPCTLPGLKGAEAAQFITSSWSSLYRRAFLERNDLMFDPEQTRFEDRLFVLSTVTQARSITFTGRPNRVWRRRAGSISVTATTPETHLLQVQLLEKCLGLIRAEVAKGRLKPIFEKRELFNTVSRLIWDMDLIKAINRSEDPRYGELAKRLVSLLGEDSFGHAIFSDKTLIPVNRVGMKTRKGRITRAAFFDIHRALRDGDFAAAQARMDVCALPEAPRLIKGKRVARRLVLHLGLHKTGTTYIQRNLIGHREALLERGILMPLTGYEDTENPARAGATPGHQGLVRAVHRNTAEPWRKMYREIDDSGAETVLLSCENMMFPTLADRDAKIAQLVGQLGGFEQVDLIAMARRADKYIEAFYRERLANGLPGTGEGLPGFVADYAADLGNFRALFDPFEQRLGTRVRLGDFDALTGYGRLWPGFLELAGLPDDLPPLEVARYPTPDRETVLLLQLLNTLVGNSGLRQEILAAWFSMHPVPTEDASLLPPAERLALLDLWQARSAEFAGSRGYVPDLSQARAGLESENWQAPETLTIAHVQELIGLANQAASGAHSRQPGTDLRLDHPIPHVPGDKPAGDMSVTIRLRPWAANLIRRIRRATG